MNAYGEAIEMKRRGLRTVEIFERLHARRTPVKYDTLLSWVNGIRSPERRLNTVRRFDGDFVELTGLLIGDGHWERIPKEGAYISGRVSYASKDLELARRAGKLMGIVLGRVDAYRPYWSAPNRVFVVECRSKHLVEVLDSAMRTRMKLIWSLRVRFLQGIYDAEGCITIRRKNGRVYPRIFLTNSDVALVGLVRKMLKSLGIESTVEMNTRAGMRKMIRGRKTTTRSDVYNVCIGRREHVLRFARMIGFGIIRKGALLRRVQLELGSGPPVGDRKEIHVSLSKTTTSR